MKVAIPIIDIIKKRCSTRSFIDKKLSTEDKENLIKYRHSLKNPFGTEVTFHIAEKKIDSKENKLGTYGIVKGASTFFGVSTSKNKKALLAAGYEFENLMLYATSIGLGTVWLTATFNRKDFIKAMKIEDDNKFIAVSPFGYPAEKLTIQDRLMRKTLKSSTRKKWKDIFFFRDFDTTLTHNLAGPYATPLEMLRLAPSAANAQPWRVLKDNDIYHFYITYKNDIYKKMDNIKHVDLGIALAHFHQTLLSLNLKGHFIEFDNINIDIPKDYYYIISWVNEK